MQWAGLLRRFGIIHDPIDQISIGDAVSSVLHNIVYSIKTVYP